MNLIISQHCILTFFVTINQQKRFEAWIQKLFSHFFGFWREKKFDPDFEKLLVDFARKKRYKRKTSTSNFDILQSYIYRVEFFDVKTHAKTLNLDFFRLATFRMLLTT